jgi:hypothetical protein
MLRERRSLKRHDARAYAESVASFVLAVLATAACGTASTGVPPHTAAEAKDDQPARSEYPVTWKSSLLEFTGHQPPGGRPQRVLEARLSHDFALDARVEVGAQDCPTPRSSWRSTATPARVSASASTRKGR